uniref:Uncharacterized protein n=1 Tax=Rhizophora mucronata TaxID=61149 RepID=A0A2P2NPU2_RHIMU
MCLQTHFYVQQLRLRGACWKPQAPPKDKKKGWLDHVRSHRPPSPGPRRLTIEPNYT